MLKAIKNFQKIKTIFTVVLVIAIIIFVFIVIAVNAVGTYVQENYIVVNKHSRVQGKQAFVREYTIATGDDTLAKIAGVDVFEERSVTFDTSNLEWGSTDYRNVVKHITGTWVQQGRYPNQSRVSALYEDCISKFSTEDEGIAYTASAFKSKFADIGSGTSNGLYTSSSGNEIDYEFESKSQKFNIQSLRCCCCLAESFCNYLCNFDTEGYGYTPRGHTGDIGLSTSANNYTTTREYKEGGETKTSRTYFTVSIARPAGTKARYVGQDLQTDIVSKGLVNTSLRELKESGYLQPGMIVTYVEKNSHAYNDSNADIPAACRHVEVITYIDDNYVYLAGAGSDQDIFMNSIVGYNTIVSLDKPILAGLDSACTDMYVGNIILWNNSQSVTK